MGKKGVVWEENKAMALATTGAVISMSIVSFINWKYDRKFGEEWWQSLAVKETRPLGEVKLHDMIEEGRKES